MAVLPIASIVINILDRHPNDCRKNQSRGTEFVKTMYSLNRSVQSIDSKNFTDRLPLSLQLIVLQELMIFLGISQKRSATLCNSLFSLLGPERRYRTDIFGHIRYAVGQPMGNLLSIPLASLTHHYMVILSHVLSGNSGTITRYCILGDDLVLSDYDISIKYLSISKELGMEISLGKSIGLEFTSSIDKPDKITSNLSEFAKRLTFNILGKPLDISPLSPFLLSTSLVRALLDLIRKDDIYLVNLGSLWSRVDLGYSNNKTMKRLTAIIFLLITLPPTLASQGIHSIYVTPSEESQKVVEGFMKEASQKDLYKNYNSFSNSMDLIYRKGNLTDKFLDKEGNYLFKEIFFKEDEIRKLIASGSVVDRKL